MIRLFTGEFLSDPCPLEMDMTTCSYQCVYCYVNIRCKKRYLNIPAINTQLQKSHIKDTLMRYCIAEGYPIAISNRTDPLARSNHIQTQAIVRIILEHGGRISPLTKGGAGIDAMLKMLEEYQQKTVWYFTITTADEKIARIIEPGAPSPDERIHMIKDVISAGHKVVVGINPLLDKWLPRDKFKELVLRLDEAGVSGYWLQKLHIGKNAKKTIPKNNLEILKSFGQDFTRESSDISRQIYVQQCVGDIVADHNVYCSLMPYRSEFQNVFFDTYPKTLPVKQQFINHCLDNYPDGALITFDEYYSVMSKGKEELLEKIFRPNEISGYVYIQGFRVVKQIKEEMYCLKDLLRFYWNLPTRVNRAPRDHNFFLLCVEGDKPLKDDQGNDVLYFNIKNMPEKRKNKNCRYDVKTGQITPNA